MRSLLRTKIREERKNKEREERKKERRGEKRKSAVEGTRSYWEMWGLPAAGPEQ